TTHTFATRWSLSKRLCHHVDIEDESPLEWLVAGTEPAHIDLHLVVADAVALVEDGVAVGRHVTKPRRLHDAKAAVAAHRSPMLAAPDTLVGLADHKLARHRGDNDLDRGVGGTAGAQIRHGAAAIGFRAGASERQQQGADGHEHRSKLTPYCHESVSPVGWILITTDKSIQARKHVEDKCQLTRRNSSVIRSPSPVGITCPSRNVQETSVSRRPLAYRVRPVRHRPDQEARLHRRVPRPADRQ